MITLNASHYIFMKNRDIYIKSNVLASNFMERNAPNTLWKFIKVCLDDLGYFIPEHTQRNSIQLRTNIVNEPPCEKVYLL